MTENAAAACVTPAQYHNPGTVGEPLPCCEVKLVDVPEMNYTHNGKGESATSLRTEGTIAFCTLLSLTLHLHVTDACAHAIYAFASQTSPTLVARSACVVTTYSTATTTCLTRRRRRWTRTAGCTRATLARWARSRCASPYIPFCLVNLDFSRLFATFCVVLG